jgi:lipid II:glycine glycyltransferase (peptidoglycan interpeptide bridge formation enzyme)
MVLNGEAFIVQGYLNDKMISASLFMHNQHSCYYGVGVYKRDLFEFSISHYPVWWAICKAKKLGCQFFDFGEMHFSNTAHLRPTNPTEKELSISHFKQGFSGLSVPILQIEGN